MAPSGNFSTVTQATKAIFAASWIGSIVLAFAIGKSREQTATPASAATDSNSKDRISALSGAGSASSRSGSEQRVGSGAPDRKNAASSLLDYAERGGENDMPRSLRDLAESMDLSQVEGTIAELEKVSPSPAQQRALKALVGRWAQLDPNNAFGYVADLDAPKLRHDAKLWVLRSWGGSDPAAALEYVKNNPDSSIGRYAESTIFAGLGDGDLSVAMNFLEGINGKDTPYSGATYTAVREMFLKNDREVINWAEKLPAGDVRDRAIHGLVDQWARYDPEAAKTWLEKNAGGKNLAEAQVELGESWARVDPESALKWAQTIEGDSKTAARAQERIFNRWLQYDYADAAQFLAAQEPAPELDRAFELYINKARSYDPGATMAWAESITDPKRRIRAMQSVASTWKGRDRDAFDAYLNDVGMTETEFRKMKVPKAEKASKKKS